MTESLRDKLRGEVMASYWEDLAPHAARSALLMLAPDHDLLDAAVVMAEDDVKRMEKLLVSGVLRRVTASEAQTWADTEDARFQFVVVQPWVLAQHLVPGVRP